MTISLIAAVLLGIVTGIAINISQVMSSVEPLMEGTGLLMDLGLCTLLFLIGIDIGKQKTILQDIKKMGIKILYVPILIALGSVVGAICVGFMFGMPMKESAAVGAGFGWYSLSAVLLAEYSETLSAIAFMSNVVREILAIILIPFIAKYIGTLESVAPSGATAMDTTLPVIAKYTDSQTAVIAFVSGSILSMMVPFLVPLIINLM